jgi:hypothetical protein
MPVQDVSFYTGEPAVREHDPVPPPRPLSCHMHSTEPSGPPATSSMRTPEEAGYGHGV